jgi:DNA-binding winged helix-turn-helix (wHTH) protein
VDTRIAELRRILEDDPADPRYIETIPGQGYRFIASVEAVP